LTTAGFAVLLVSGPLFAGSQPPLFRRLQTLAGLNATLSLFNLRPIVPRHYESHYEKTRPRPQRSAVLGVLLSLTKGTPMIAKSQTEFLQRHVRGDWGGVREEDRQLNAQALMDGSRVLSSHRTSLGEKL
jgi:hypothetical protein